MVNIIKIRVSEVPDLVENSKNVKTHLENSYKASESLHAYIKGSNWGGESKLAFLTYLEIVKQYHRDLSMAFEHQTSAMDNVGTNYEEYYSNSVRVVRDL